MSHAATDIPMTAAEQQARRDLVARAKPVEVPRPILVTGNKDFHWVTEKICGIPEGKTPLWWWVLFLVASVCASFTLFGLIWGLALAGCVFKLYFTGRFKGLSTAIYVAMGWLVLIAIEPMLRLLPTWTLGWLFAGGVAYTVGALFYMSRRLPYAHAIWHAFVIAGSVCHFVAVATQVLAPDYA